MKLIFQPNDDQNYDVQIVNEKYEILYEFHITEKQVDNLLTELTNSLNGDHNDPVSLELLA